MNFDSSDIKYGLDFSVYHDTFEELISESEIETINLQGKKIKDIQDDDFIVTEDGSVLEMEKNFSESDGDIALEDITLKDLGFENVKKVLLEDGVEYNKFVLFQSGSIECFGDNKNGQLGDSTTLDYYDGYLKRDEALFMDMFIGEDDSREGGKFIVALDDQYNVWAWGYNFGSTPQIIVYQSEFYSIDEYN